jgi:serine/threonine protein kinase
VRVFPFQLFLVFILFVFRYSTPLDVWSIGAIFAELANKKPLLPGDSEYDQLMKTFMVFGTPTEDIWPGVSELPDYKVCIHVIK